VSRVSLPKHEVVQTVKLEGANVKPMGVVVSPDGARAYVTTGRGGTVVAMDARTNHVVGSVTIGGRPWGIAISPDGKRIYTANGPTDDVSVIDTVSLQEVRRIKVGSRPWGAVLVPTTGS
jgi:YVTN family beta-propeller protein